MVEPPSTFLNEKYIVYHDQNYHQSWIYRKATIQIVDYLTSNERQKKFVILDAEKLFDWVNNRTDSNSSGTVIVFSQDMIPENVAPDTSPSIPLRKYLDNGGRVVWMGDIPFWRQGKKFTNIFNKNLDEISKEHLIAKSQGENKFWVEWGLGGIFSILGLNADFNYSPTEKVYVTNSGAKWGLKNRWYGTRPIQERSQKNLTVLAKSSAYKYKLPELIRSDHEEPKVVKEKIISSILDYFKLLTLLIAIIGGYGTYSYVKEWLFQNMYNYVLFGAVIFLFFIIIIGKSLLDIFRIYFPKQYANSWIKNFNSKYPNSGFIRIWDMQIYNLNNEELTELYKLSTKDI